MTIAYRAPQKSEVYQSKDGSWSIPPPLRQSREMIYNFTGLGGKVRAIMHDRPDMSDEERAELAYTTMRLAYEHIMSRVIMALETDKELLANPPQTLVISGGVASSRFLRHVAASMLQAHGFDNMTVTAPKPDLCTDNAQMIAWAGLKMYEAGWTTGISFLPQGEWPIEEIITGVDCWRRNRSAVGRRKVTAKFVKFTKEKSSEIKSKSADEKPSVKPDPGPSSSQDGQHAPGSEGLGSPQEETAWTRPSQATDSPAHSGGSPRAPTRRGTWAGAQPRGVRRVMVGSDHPLHYLQEEGDRILQSMNRRAGGPPPERESERESTDDDAAWRNEQVLRAFRDVQTDTDGDLVPKLQPGTPEKPLGIPSSKSTERTKPLCIPNTRPTGERKPLGIPSTRSTGKMKRVHDAKSTGDKKPLGIHSTLRTWEMKRVHDAKPTGTKKLLSIPNTKSTGEAKKAENGYRRILERKLMPEDAPRRNNLTASRGVQTGADGDQAPKPQPGTSDKPLGTPSSKPTGERKPLGVPSTRSTGEMKRVHDGAKPIPPRGGEAKKEVEGTVKHEEEKREKRFVRLLPPAPAPAPAENQAPEGSLQTGLNRLKKWIGL